MDLDSDVVFLFHLAANKEVIQKKHCEGKRIYPYFYRPK